MSKKITNNQLKKLNLLLAGLYGLQGVILLVLSKTVTVPITLNYLTRDSLASKPDSAVLAPASHALFDINLAYLVAAVLFLAAIARLLHATTYRKRYESELKKGINRTRWVEYGVNGGLALAVAALLVGVRDISSLIMLFVLALVASLLGMVIEIQQDKAEQRIDRLSTAISLLAGIVPWLVLLCYVAGSHMYGNSQLPSYVYGVYASVLLLFGAIALNTRLVRRKTGKWSDYLYGELAYLVLGFVATSALAWLVFGGALRS